MKTLITLCIVFMSATAFAQNEIKLDNKMFAGNWFDNLEQAKQNPDKVFYLDLSLQKLKTFPEVIYTFKNLKELHLSYNYWESIPAGIGALTQLELLDLSGNYYLNKLPGDLNTLNGHLKTFLVKDNKLNAGEVEKAKQAMPNVQVVAK